MSHTSEALPWYFRWPNLQKDSAQMKSSEGLNSTMPEFPMGETQCGTLSGTPSSKSAMSNPPSTTEQPSSDPNQGQIGGDHYKRLGDYQPWEVLKYWLTREEYRGYMKGTAIVYLARERQKGGDEDIGKSGHYLQKLLQELARLSAEDHGT